MITKENWIHFEKIDSTNDYLLKNDFPSGTIITAATQTKGKGRNQRKWIDIPNQTFIFSLLLKFKTFPYSFYSLLIALCVLEAAKEIQKEFIKENYDFFIKWPNDILLKKNQKIGKLAGILIETQWKESHWNVVVGIGLNWKSVPEIQDRKLKFPPIGLFSEDFKNPPNFFLDYLIKQMNLFSIENPHSFFSYLNFIHQYHFLYQKKVKIDNQIFLVDKINEEGYLKIINIETKELKILIDWSDDYEILTNN